MAHRIVVLAALVILASCGEEAAVERPGKAGVAVAPATASPVPSHAAIAPATNTPARPPVPDTHTEPAAVLPATSVPAASREEPVRSDPDTATSEKRRIVAARPGDPLRFTRVRGIDRDGIGVEAFSLLAPTGWRFTGGVFWPLRNPGMPGNLTYKVTSPDGAAQLQVFPTLAYVWMDDRTLLRHFPLGSNHLGSEVHPPLGPLEVLRDIVVPRYRRDAVEPRELEAKPIAGLARRLAGTGPLPPGGAAALRGARLRIEYRLDGHLVEEEFHAAVEKQTAPAPTSEGVALATHWIVSYLFAFRAPRGRLADYRDTFEAMVRSFRIHPRWFNKYNQLIALSVANKVPDLDGPAGIRKVLADSDEALSDAMLRAWQQQNATYNRLLDAFVQSVRGVETYADPACHDPVRLPAGCERAWGNGRGDYVATRNPDYDPNAALEGEWTPLRLQPAARH